MTLSEYIDSIRGKTIGVIGAGVSNTPWIELLLREGCRVCVHDRRTREKMGPDAEKLEALGAKLCLGEDYLESLEEDILFRTPGLMPFDEHLVRARERGAVLSSEMELFFALCPCPILAVTGSDGKTTTTTLISELLKSAGYTVHLGGNIGKPLLCELPLIRAEDVAVLELSSFQLHSMNCRPQVAVITNISPNHLDKHKDYQDYIDAKANIFLRQEAGDRLVLCADDPHSAYYRGMARGRVSFFANGHAVENGSWCDGESLYRHGRRVMAKGEIRLPGEHNVLNLLTAFEATEGLVDDEVCRTVARSFAGVAHRLELVRELGGVQYINDSIGSSPSRTIAGLRAMRRPPIVICGGYDKHIPFDPLGEALCELAKAAVLTGATAEKIRGAVEAAERAGHPKLPLRLVPDFDEAVRTAAAMAEAGDIVLLSPACASFDRFRNFEERGEHFRALVTALDGQEKNEK